MQRLTIHAFHLHGSLQQCREVTLTISKLLQVTSCHTRLHSVTDCTEHSTATCSTITRCLVSETWHNQLRVTPENVVVVVVVVVVAVGGVGVGVGGVGVGEGVWVGVGVEVGEAGEVGVEGVVVGVGTSAVVLVTFTIYLQVCRYSQCHQNRLIFLLLFSQPARSQPYK